MKFDLSKENTLLQVELAKVKRRGEELQTVLDLQSSSGYASQSSGPSLALLSQLQLRRHPESGDTITLTLSNKVQCYTKPAGQRNAVNMEVVKDITGGAKTISFFVVVLRQHLCSPTAFRQRT